MDKTIGKDFSKYVSLNVLGMIGISCYILADTFFVSKALGATGLAALNLSISIYSVMHGIGLMIGIGGATRYNILSTKSKEQKTNKVFSISVSVGLIIGLIFLLIGVGASKPLATMLGANAETLDLTNTYLKTILIFAPFFILNNVLLAFVRNDNSPRLSMIAMLTGSISNIILDYVFIFPFGMGIFGAAFATGLAPIISIGVLSIHFITKNNRFEFIKTKMNLHAIKDIFSLGLSAFINEVSSAVVLITFNLVILGIAGNIGVASYGIVANISLVGIAIFTGLSQGIQPLISKAHGLQDGETVNKVLKYAITTSLILSFIIYIGMFTQAESIVQIFNDQNNAQIASLATTGLRIYFIGLIFAGLNIVIASFLSAMESPRNAFIVSIGRGIVVIIPAVIILTNLLQMTGVWLSFVVTEMLVCIVAATIVQKRKKVGYKLSIDTRV